MGIPRIRSVAQMQLKAFFNSFANIHQINIKIKICIAFFISKYLISVSDMSTSSKSKKSSKTDIPLETFVGSVHEELEAPSTSEIVFRKIWTIRNFNKTVSRRELIDSPDFRCSVNGVTTYWNMSIRFWKGKYDNYKSYYNRYNFK